MTRRFFGSVERELEGKTWRLVLDFNAICRFEDATGLAFFEWSEALGKSAPRARELRALVHAAMGEHHTDATAEDAGRLASADLDLFRDLMQAAHAGMPEADGKKPKAAA